MPRYKTGHDPREQGRQLTISFFEGEVFTLAKMKKALEMLESVNVQPKDGFFCIHPEFLKDPTLKKDLDILFGGGMMETVKSESYTLQEPTDDADTAKTSTDESSTADYLLLDTASGSDFL